MVWPMPRTEETEESGPSFSIRKNTEQHNNAQDNINGFESIMYYCLCRCIYRISRYRIFSQECPRMYAALVSPRKIMKRIE